MQFELPTIKHRRVIHKFLVLIKNHLNYFKDSIFECFYKEYSGVFLLIFSQHIMMESVSLEQEKIIKDRILRDIMNFFKHEEEENYYKLLE